MAASSDPIVVERRARERQMIRVGNIQRQAIADIDAASGDAIDAIATVAISEIAGSA